MNKKYQDISGLILIISVFGMAVSIVWRGFEWDWINKIIVTIIIVSFGFTCPLFYKD